MQKQQHDKAAMNALLDQLITSTNSAIAVIDDALAYMSDSNKRIAALEAKHEANRKAKQKVKTTCVKRAFQKMANISILK